MISGGPVPSLAPMTDPSMKAFAAVVYAFAAFTATFAAVSLSLRFLSGYSAVRRYLAEASYWIYLIHLPLVMAGQVLMLEVSLPGGASWGASSWASWPCRCSAMNCWCATPSSARR